MEKILVEVPRFTKMSQIDLNLPNRKILKLLSLLPRRASSILVQLRTGHVSLNAFLKKIKVLDTTLCRKCRQPATITHYLKHCTRFKEQCNHLRRKAGKACHAIPWLLGDPNIILFTLRYIQDTRRFDKYTDIEKTETSLSLSSYERITNCSPLLHRTPLLTLGSRFLPTLHP
jgi:hypothetical protein